MDRTDFTKAAFQPSHRPALLDQLRADGMLRRLAQARVAEINEMERTRGSIRDFCHITRMEHETLTRLLGQIAAQAEPDVTVE